MYLCGGEDIASKERIGDAEHHLGLPAAMSTDKTEGGTYESSKKFLLLRMQNLAFLRNIHVVK